VAQMGKQYQTPYIASKQLFLFDTQDNFSTSTIPRDGNQVLTMKGMFLTDIYTKL
jgi:hypothetical protein